MGETGDSRFRQWLGKRDFSDRSAGDICSRLGRLARLIDVTKISTPEELEVAIIKASGFKALSASVRSQLKRAGKLRLEFEAEQSP